MLKFIKDLAVCDRMLAVKSETKYTKKFGKVERQMIKARVICGSNCKESTRYFVEFNKDLKTTKNKRIAKSFTDLSDKEFVRIYPKQCGRFKDMFNEEYAKTLKKLKDLEKLKNKSSK